MEVTSMDILEFRRFMYSEISKLNCMFGPEGKDFDKVKPQVISLIAYKNWEKLGKPTNLDAEIWLDAEKTWDFMRYMW